MSDKRSFLYRNIYLKKANFLFFSYFSMQLFGMLFSYKSFYWGSVFFLPLFFLMASWIEIKYRNRSIRNAIFTTAFVSFLFGFIAYLGASLIKGVRMGVRIDKIMIDPFFVNYAFISGVSSSFICISWVLVWKRYGKKWEE